MHLLCGCLRESRRGLAHLASRGKLLMLRAEWHGNLKISLSQIIVNLRAGSPIERICPIHPGMLASTSFSLELEQLEVILIEALTNVGFLVILI